LIAGGGERRSPRSPNRSTEGYLTNRKAGVFTGVCRFLLLQKAQEGGGNMQFNYLITDQVIIPFFIILFVFTAYGGIEMALGHFFRPLTAIVLVFALLILFTDLRTEELLRSRSSFNGVITPEIEYIETTMPVIFTEIVETGVITGGYEHEENTHHSI
jgi:hypothetical protein